MNLVFEIPMKREAAALQSCGKKHFSSQLYSNSILAGFSQLREDGSLCDITLYAENRPFLAHKGLLASASDYFRGTNYKFTRYQIFYNEITFLGNVN